MFHGQITHHLGSTTQPDGKVVWDTSWVPDQPGPMEMAARITDRTGLIYMTEAVGGLKLVRPGLSVELCKPFDVPRSFTGCQYGEWVIPGVRTEKFTIRGDLSRILDVRYVIASWGGQKLCHGYRINDVLLNRDMPGMDGVEVCHQIKADPGFVDVLVVLISGTYTRSEEQVVRLESDADGYLVRPIPNRELVARVEPFVRILRLSLSLRSRERELTTLAYRTSYSHRGAYYTLDSVAHYDAQGLWAYQDIYFSRHGLG